MEEYVSLKSQYTVCHHIDYILTPLTHLYAQRLSFWWEQILYPTLILSSATVSRREYQCY